MQVTRAQEAAVTGLLSGMCVVLIGHWLNPDRPPPEALGPVKVALNFAILLAGLGLALFSPAHLRSGAFAFAAGGIMVKGALQAMHAEAVGDDLFVEFVAGYVGPGGALLIAWVVFEWLAEWFKRRSAA